MKSYLLILCLVIGGFTLCAQESVESLVKAGIGYHDDGDYNLALTTYGKALAIDAKSPLVHYEMAVTYFQMADYPAAVKHADKALKEKGRYTIPAVMIKGSALDMMGKVKKSIKLFEKTIAEEEPHYLLFYNLALNYFKIDNYQAAADNCMRAIMENPNHTSSHFLLGNAESGMRHKVPALLALYFYLFLEPEAARSSDAFDLLRYNLTGNVKKEAGKPNTINISLNLGGAAEFAAAEMILSLRGAADLGEAAEPKTAEETFFATTELLLSTLGASSGDKPDNVYWNLYVPYLTDIQQSEHLATFCHYISQSESEASRVWLEENPEAVKAFGDWLERE